MTTSRGVLYVAWGKAHVDVARRSAASVKRSNPGIQTAIFCHADDDTSGFDHGLVIPEGHKRPKVSMLRHSPFDETLYLDNDTIVRADLGSLYDLLKRYDLCGAQVILWHRPRHNKAISGAVPESFPEINCGVLLYRKCAATDTFFDQWLETFLQAGFGVDQPSFREVLWQSDIRFYVLPPQFNKRVFEASELIWTDQPKPRILHLDVLRPTRNRLKAWFSNRIG